MPALQNGALRLVRVFGIDVFVHWSWLVVALIELQNRQQGRYAAAHWHVIEYLSLFGIVLVHEFGHALACRSVGGKADRIMLWPLGGVAYVSPPPRPGAVLWSIAAIGHAPKDALMFHECGLAIAMGQASAAVQRQACFITRSNDADGFAYAVERWVLGPPSTSRRVA